MIQQWRGDESVDTSYRRESVWGLRSNWVWRQWRPREGSAVIRQDYTLMVLCGGWIEWSQAEGREIGLEVDKIDRPRLLLKYSWWGRWESGGRGEGSHEDRGWGVFENPLAEEQKGQWLCFLAWKTQWLQRLALLFFMGWDDNCFHSEPVKFEVSVEQRDADVRQDPEPRMRVMGDGDLRGNQLRLTPVPRLTQEESLPVVKKHSDEL